MADPNETGGWVIDPKNPNRAVYTDEDGNQYEAFKQTVTSAPKEQIPPVSPRGAGERFIDAYKEGAQYGAPGLIARTVMGERAPEAQKQLREQAIARDEADPIFREGDSFLEKVGILDREDGSNPVVQGGARLLGGMLGGIGPEALFMPGGTAGGRVLGQAVIGGVSDAAYQAKELLDEVREEIDLAEVGLGAAMGAGFQGLVETPTFVRDLFKARGKNTTPDAAPRFNTEDDATYRGLLETGSVEDILGFLDGRANIDEKALADYVAKRDSGQPVSTTPVYANSLEKEAAEFQPTADPTADELFAPKPRKPLAEEAAEFQGSREPTAEDVFGESAPVPSTREPTPEDLFGPEPATPKAPSIEDAVTTQRLTDAQNHVESITQDWTNRPDIEIVGSSKSLTEAYPEASPDAVGFVTPEGKVVLNLENVAADAKALGVSEADVLTSVTFHESLGHYGLSQKFGDDLDNTLSNLYEGSTWFKREVDRWMEANPDENLDVVRAADEVLAEMSEKGKVPAPVMNKLRQWIKGFARSMGLNLDVSEREVRAILAASHAAVTDGVRQDVATNGFRHMTTWHGTPRDEPFEKFDHSYMSSGEGAQVFGWGTYLTEVRDIADKMYRERLAPGDMRHRGRKYQYDDFEQLHDDMLKEFREIFPQHNELDSKRLGLYLRRTLDDHPDHTNITPRQVAESISIRRGDWLDRNPDFYAEGTVADDIAKYLREEPVQRGRRGNLYEVEIPDDATWLLYDKPLSEQPEAVRKFFAKEIMPKVGKTIQSLQSDIKKSEKRIQDIETNRVPYPGDDELLNIEESIFMNKKSIAQLRNPKGADIYRFYANVKGSDKAASQAMHEAGIAGNKYLTGMDRGKGDGRFNYVVFDDNTPKITNRYMKRRGDKKAEANRVGGVNLDNISKVEDIDYFLGRAKEIAESNGEDFTSVPRPETVRMGRDLGLTNAKVMKDGFSEKGLAARIDAGMQVLVNQLEKVEKISSRISTNGSSAADTLRLSKEMTILAAVYARVSGNNSEVGRALNILNRMRAATGNADDILKYMKLHGNTVFTNPQHVQQLAQLVQNAATPAQKVKVIAAAMQPRAEDYIFRAYYNMMLSNPATHTTNFAGTALNFVTDMMENTGAAIIGQRNRGSNMDRIRGREVMYRMYGAMRGFMDAATWAETRQALKTGQVGGQTTAKAGNSNVYTGTDPVKGFMSGLFESPTRALAGADEFWRNVLQASNLHGLAVRNAGNQGLKGKAFWQEVNRLTMQPTKEMIEATENYTKVLQFMDKPSFIAEGLIRAQTAGPKAGIPERVAKSVLKFAVPFVRTPDALIRTAIRRSPLAWERENINGWKMGGAERDKVAARLMIGSAIAFYVASQAFEGNVNGDGPKDYRKRTAWSSANLPNSIKVGDEWHSIQGLEPVSTNILGIATLVERYKAGEISSENYAESAASAIHGIASVLSENSYMESFNQFMKIWSGDPRQEQSALENFLVGLAASVTTPSIVRGYARSIDPAVRDATGDGSLESRLYGRIASSVPGLSETLPQRSDVFGRPQTRDVTGSAMYTRSEVKPEEADPAVVEIARLENKGKELILGAPSKSGIKVNGEKRRLNAEEFQNYQALSGYWITAAVNQYMQDPEWATLSDEEKIGVIKDTTKEARKAAREYLFDTSDDDDEDE